MDSADVQAAKSESAFRLLLGIWLTTALALAGFALVIAIVMKTVRSPVYDDAFFAQFCLLKQAFYVAQPAKNVAYLASCLAAPLILAGSWFLAERWMEKVPARRLLLLFRCANLANGVFFVWCLFSLVYCPLPAMWAEFPNWLTYSWLFEGQPFLTLKRVILFVAAGLLLWRFYGVPTTHRNRNLALLAIVATGLPAIFCRFYLPVEIDGSWRFTHHLNPLVFALSQAVGGHTYLVHFPHRYGGYCELLAPVLALLPRRVETILFIFGALNVVVLLSLLVAARLLIRSPLHLVLAGWSLLGMLTLDLGDAYYQCSVVRGLFPAVGLVVAILYLRRPGPVLYALVSVVAALAIPWNADTGLVLWGGWTATLIFRKWCGGSLYAAWRHLVLQILLLIAAVLTFVLTLRVVSGAWPDFALAFASQKVFAGLGYYCLRIIVPDVWMLVATIDVLGLAIVLISCQRGFASWRTHALCLISLMSIGLFSYFVGRSAESNLVSASFLMPIQLGLVFSETQGWIALQRLPRQVWVLLVPVLSIQVWWALLFVLAAPLLIDRSSAKLVDATRDGSATPFGQDVAFIQGRTRPGEDLYILSDHSGFYHYLSRTVSDLDLPSTDEFVWTRDIDRLVSAIDAHQIPQLFVDQNFFATPLYRDAVYERIKQAIAQNYRTETIGPDGRVILYRPR